MFCSRGRGYNRGNGGRRCWCASYALPRQVGTPHTLHTTTPTPCCANRMATCSPPEYCSTHCTANFPPCHVKFQKITVKVAITRLFSTFGEFSLSDPRAFPPANAVYRAHGSTRPRSPTAHNNPQCCTCTSSRLAVHIRSKGKLCPPTSRNSRAGGWRCGCGWLAQCHRCWHHMPRR